MEGVRFAYGERVELTGGRHAGATGTIVLLVALAPEPSYLVRLGTPAVEVRAPQAALRSAS